MKIFFAKRNIRCICLNLFERFKNKKVFYKDSQTKIYSNNEKYEIKLTQNKDIFKIIYILRMMY